MAQYVAEQWTAQGLEDVVIRRYDVLSSNPREVQVEMVAPVRYVPTLREDAYKEDPDTAAPGGQRRLALLLGLGRRHGAGGLREQRQPGRLRPCSARTGSTPAGRSWWSATRTRTAIAASRP